MWASVCFSLSAWQWTGGVPSKHSHRKTISGPSNFSVTPNNRKQRISTVQSTTALLCCWFQSISRGALKCLAQRHLCLLLKEEEEDHCLFKFPAQDFPKMSSQVLITSPLSNLIKMQPECYLSTILDVHIEKLLMSAMLSAEERLEGPDNVILLLIHGCFPYVSSCRTGTWTTLTVTQPFISIANAHSYTVQCVDYNTKQMCVWSYTWQIFLHSIVLVDLYTLSLSL